MKKKSPSQKISEELIKEKSKPSATNNRYQRRTDDLTTGRPRVWTEETINELADKLLEWSREHTSLVLEEFYSKNGLHHQRCSEFAKANERFADAFKRAKASCMSNLCQAGLLGETKEALTIFLLKNYGMTDRQVVEHTGEMKESITVYLPSRDN